MSLLEVCGLRTEVATPAGTATVVDGLSFTLEKGETLCIAGESGSGKSMTALSLMGLLPHAARVGGGTAMFKGRDLFTLSEPQMRGVRGNDIGMIFQEPMTSLNPVLSVGRQLADAITSHERLAGAAVHRRARELLEQVRIPEAERRLAQFPHELSGGMRQRVMIAMALSQNPDILIADEPTTALDVTVQAQILALIRSLQKETGAAVILITHDMGVVAEMADRVLMMKSGQKVEEGPVKAIFSGPKADYTKALLAAVPRLGSMAGTVAPKRPEAPTGVAPIPVVDVSNLTVQFDMRGSFMRARKRLHAVANVSFTLAPGETLALVGESGSGKSTTGKALLNLVPFTGEVAIAGTQIKGLSPREMKPVLRDIQMIFQDPYASLDPRMRVGELIGEPLKIHRLAKGDDLADRVSHLLGRVGLQRDHMNRYPHEFSGGQRQRICIARALSLSPKVIVADESVSALDVSIQAQVLDLLRDIQNETRVAYIFISHDMAVVEQISHRVAVMYRGAFVETGTRAQVFEDPRHAYTRALLAAVPVPDPTRERPASIATGEEFVLPPGAAAYAYRDVGDGHLVVMRER